jgi:hypothetical protein
MEKWVLFGNEGENGKLGMEDRRLPFSALDGLDAPYTKTDRS